MGAGTAGLRPLRRELALAAVIACLGIAAAAWVEADVRDRHDQASDRAQAGVSDVTNTRYDRLAGRVNQYANVLNHSPGAGARALLAGAPRADFSSLGLLANPSLEENDPLRSGSSTKPNGVATLAADARRAEIRASSAIARDSAQPVAVVVGAPAEARLVVTWPLYTGPVPQDTASRRAESAGWVIGSTSLQDAVAPVFAVARGQDIEPTVNVDVSHAGPGTTQSVLTSAAQVRVAGVPNESRVPTLLLVGLTAVAVLGIVGLAWVRRRSDDEIEHRDRGLREQIELVSDISVTLQESLDMGVVLPAALTQIAQTHELSFISIVPGADSIGRATEMLSLGRRPAILPAQRWSPESRTATAGQLVRLPLRRSNRTLGYLEAIPVKALDTVELASLRSTADLLASAMYNADLYEREQENVRRLRELDEMKDDFLSTVSHELRTPLSVLVGFTSLLGNDWDRLPEHVRRESVDKMKIHVASLTHLVNDLLDFISERRSTSGVPEEIRLDRRVGEVVDQLRPLCQHQNVTVTMPSEVQAWTDPRAVERIIGNLVSNAAKYSPPGSTIAVSVEAGADMASVTVADQGPGIRPEDRQRIFERFYRGESDAARSTRGSGIGLAVVRTWLQAVGARLDVASDVGVGTTMTVRFPLVPGLPVDGAGSIRWLESAVREEERVP